MTVELLSTARTGDGPRPFGTAFLPELGRGVDLDAAGYVEEELVVRGEADLHAHDGELRRVVVRGGVPYTTRLLVRRPADLDRCSGIVHLEPLHPAGDMPLSWSAVHAHLLREGHAWVGVSYHPLPVELLRTRVDPERYGGLDVPDGGLGWSMLAGIGRFLREEGAGAAFGGARVDRLLMSGWSMTGTFCRVFVAEGFHDEARRADGSPVFDGYAYCISAGAFERGGYTPLSEGSPVLPLDDPRRTVRPRDVPVFEIQSENEAEQNVRSLREDGDAADDRYRLYQIAGASHASAPRSRESPVNDEQLRRCGVPTPSREIVEEHTTFRNDFVARALFRHLEEWVVAGRVPPRADRLRLGDPASSLPRGRWSGAVPVARDEHGNGLGGVRSTAVDVPVASYLPHSTMAPSYESSANVGPVRLAREDAGDLIGHMVPFTHDRLARLYASHDDYVSRVRNRAQELVAGGWLLAPEAEATCAEAEAADVP